MILIHFEFILWNRKGKYPGVSILLVFFLKCLNYFSIFIISFMALDTLLLILQNHFTLCLTPGKRDHIYEVYEQDLSIIYINQLIMNIHVVTCYLSVTVLLSFIIKT